MRIFTFDQKQTFAADRDTVFAFFSDATNLERLTPPWLRFHIVTEQPIVMRAGLLIDYRLRVHLVPLRWQSEITDWEPPFRFVDEQRKGPYRYWRHEHRFVECGEDGSGTAVYDQVRYAVRGGGLVNRLFVAPDIERIFAFRRDRLRELLGGPAACSRKVSPGGGGA